MTYGIPPRSSHALTGSQFVASISKMDRRLREQAILNQLLSGNLPGFLRKLVPINFSEKFSGNVFSATIFVMPDYLAIGSDKDFLRIPMNLYTATAVANRFGFLLPTKKIVDAIYRRSSYRFTPQPLAAGAQMSSTQYYETHNEIINRQSQARAFPLDALVAGHKKDLVLTNRLNLHPNRIAIYGWHRATGTPIQPLSIVHGAGYADYSHGIRLVAKMALIEGDLQSIEDILTDSLRAEALSDEGPIQVALLSQ